MPPISFSVSEVRVAATCPRILYFDAEHTRRNNLKARSITRIWKAGDAETTACGSLFHNAVEKFNREAIEAPEVRKTLQSGRDRESILRELQEYINGHCINLEALATKDIPQRMAFIKALHVYIGELADIVVDALNRGKPVDAILDQMFGDRRKRVDVTFQVGPNGEEVHITGILDYVFYDWRTENHRIIDYKLTPAHEPSNDLFQIGLYSLMHHVQHKTQPNVGVLYLHPDRAMVEMSWDVIDQKRHQVYDLLASMAEWVQYDEVTKAGLKPIGEPSACRHCRWNQENECVQRLGPKHEGQRFRHWTEGAASAQETQEPSISVREAEPSQGTDPLPEHVVRVVVENVTKATKSRNVSAETSKDSHPSGLPPRPRDDSLRIGATLDGNHSVGLPISALPTHLAVVGAAGSGKTWMAKVLAEEAVRAGVPVLAIDPQGDLVQFLKPVPESEKLTPEERQLRREFLERVEPRIWTPGSSHGRRLSLDPIRLASPDELGHVSPERRQEEWEGMLAVAASQVIDMASIGGEESAQQAFLLQLLRKLTSGGNHEEVDLGRVAAAVFEPEGVGLENADLFIKKSEREKLSRKLNALLHGPAATLYSGGTRLDLNKLCQGEASGKTPLNVIYLNALTDDDQKHFFVASLAAEIYRWMVTSLDPGDRPHLLFYLDEARDFIPAGTSKPPAKMPLIRLFTQGRKYGVACLICTQSPRSVDYNVFGNCSTKLIGRLESSQDLDRVAEWFGNEGRPAWLNGRKGADKGSFIGRWPGIAPTLEGQAFLGRPLFSTHEGAWSPDRLESEMSR